MKKLLSFVIGLLCASLLLSSCSSKKGMMEKIFDPNAERKNVTFTSATPLATNGSLVLHGEGITAFEKGSPARMVEVYSHYAKKYVKKLQDTAETKHFLRTLGEHAFMVLYADAAQCKEKFEAGMDLVEIKGFDKGFFMPRNAAVSLELYDASGNVIARKNHIAPSDLSNCFGLWSWLDLLWFADSIYRAEDGLLSLVKRYTLTSMPSVNRQMGEYYYYVSDGRIKAYDSSLNLRFVYEAPRYLEDISGAEFFILDNGNVLVQQSVPVPEDSENYDVYTSYNELDFVKALLYQRLISIEDGTVTELENDFYISEVIRNEDAFLSEKTDNLASITYIDTENKRMDMSNAAKDFVVLSNEGTVERSIKFFDEMADLPRTLKNGYFSCYTTTGEAWILDTDGKVVSKYSEGRAALYGKYLLTDNAIYDLRGNVVFDYGLKDVKVLHTLEGGTVLYKVVDGENETAYVLANGQEIRLGSLTGEQSVWLNASSSPYYYSIYYDGKHRYYNANGEQIGEYDTELVAVGACHDGILMQKSDEYGTVQNDAGGYYMFNLTTQTVYGYEP